MAKLQGKVALISGGTTGIGAATAKLFRDEGAKVIVTGSNPRTLEAARSELTDIEVVASDAADPDASRALVERVKSAHGRIDILFVNAGIADSSPVEATETALFDRVFAVNVRGAYFLMQHGAAAMSDGGSIVLTGSIAGIASFPGMTVYSATKAALRSFGRGFATELAPRRIRVNTISPGPIDTPIITKSGMSDEQIKAFIDGVVGSIPLARVGAAEEVARAALFLASDDSSYTTGAELFVDGGYVDAG